MASRCSSLSQDTPPYRRWPRQPHPTLSTGFSVVTSAGPLHWTRFDCKGGWLGVFPLNGSHRGPRDADLVAVDIQFEACGPDADIDAPEVQLSVVVGANRHDVRRM